MQGKVMKQFQRLLRNVKSFSDDQVEVLLDGLDFDQPLKHFNIRIRPNGGPYRGGTFEFFISLQDEGPPRVFCETQIYHPNIDPDDNCLCFNLLDDLWEDTLTLEDIVQGLLFLFYHPAIDDPLSHHFNGSESWEEFEENVRASLRGESINDYDFKRNLIEEESTEKAKSTQEAVKVISLERRHSFAGELVNINFDLYMLNELTPPSCTKAPQPSLVEHEPPSSSPLRHVLSCGDVARCQLPVMRANCYTNPRHRRDMDGYCTSDTDSSDTDCDTDYDHMTDHERDDGGDDDTSSVPAGDDDTSSVAARDDNTRSVAAESLTFHERVCTCHLLGSVSDSSGTSVDACPGMASASSPAPVAVDRNNIKRIGRQLTSLVMGLVRCL
ncbi:uncharacterized protein LOC135828557 [Sycon ciliatum]|uniref:uncharacterized protein LOC135828557 n=1 Tax=Sycon ciliatum TaxID=27933 RepID=UPI0031F70C2D